MDLFITDNAIRSVMKSRGFTFEYSDLDKPEGKVRQYWDRLDKESLKLYFYVIRKADCTEIHSVEKDDFATLRLTFPDKGFELKSSKETRYAFIPGIAMEDVIDFLSDV
jgi:hypothetical protein